MRVVVGSDHLGFELKEYLKEKLIEWGHQVEDLGPHWTGEWVGYPEIGAVVGRRVVEIGSSARGLCVCGTGLGIAIAANRIAGVRAAPVSNTTSARLAREHDDANVLCVGQRLVVRSAAEDALRAFLEADFEGSGPEAPVQLDALEYARWNA